MVKKKVKKVNIKKLQIEDTQVSYKFILIAFLVVVVFLSIIAGLLSVLNDESVKTNESDEKECETIRVSDNPSFLSLGDSTIVKMRLPAVDEEGNGVHTGLVVEAIPGTGRTLTDIDNLLFWADTQHSIRIARRVAENITGKKESNYDIIYSIEANASIIGGPSAGSALAIATIAALEGREPKDNVMITGSINHDGSIGPVSSILEKAKASKDVGATTFLVPLLQSRDVIYEQTEHCETFGHTEVCTTETRPKKIEVEEEVGIKVREVETVQDALKYYF